MIRTGSGLAAAALMLALAGCVATPGGGPAPPSVTASASAFTQCGGASWYALSGRTASGERADPTSLSAAHPSLPFGTRVRVTNLRNGRSVVVRVNDRGPFRGGRIIDVTKAAAAELDFVNRGTARVRVEPLVRAGAAATAAC